MGTILVAHAPAAEARAARVREKLAGLGYTIKEALPAPGAFAQRQLNGAIDKAQCVLVLWSKEAPAAPGMIAAAARAQAAGKLALARLDKAAPPVRIRTAAADLSAWMGRETRAWKSLLARLPALGKSTANAKPAPTRSIAPSLAASAPAKKKSGAGIWIGLLLATLAAGGAAAAYFYLS
ncbi:MAG: hypothetical protein AB7J28_06350 [Hyphomonadaceae bacterium]